MSETFVLALSAALALAAVVGTGWAMWRITRHVPSRHRALSYVLWSVTGTTLIGVVLPAIVMGMVDPFPIWMVQATFTSATAAALGWRIFEEYLVDAAGLGDIPVEVLREELVHAARRAGATPWPSPPDPPSLHR